MSNQSADSVENTNKPAHLHGRAIWALAGAAIGGAFLYAVAGTEAGVLYVLIGAIIGASAGYGIYNFSFDGIPGHEFDVCRKILQVKGRLIADAVAGMDAASRRRVVRCRVVIFACFIFAMFYALVLMTLEAGNDKAYKEWLHFFTPLVGLMSDFFPRAGAVRDALQDNGYAARAEFAEHMVVMARLFCLPAIVAAVINFIIVRHQCNRIRLRCTRPAYELFSFSVYAWVVVVVFVFGGMYESGFTDALDFEHDAGGASRFFQYHRTTGAAFVEVMLSSIYPMTIRDMQYHVILSRTQPVYTD